jgi:formamidopyrimidine-DNA glycosylase
LSPAQPPQKHDHVDVVFANGLCLRLSDPRRFGAVLWTRDDPLQHPLLAQLGVEPLTTAFNSRYLLAQTRNKNIPIKSLLMQAKVVAGIGNIYANEALFAAGIHPQRPARQLMPPECQKLVKSIKAILQCAIKQGGTTLRDFLGSDGKPGYFRHHLQVYGRGGQPCRHCATVLSEIRMGQRPTIFCANCQK